MEKSDVEDSFQPSCQLTPDGILCSVDCNETDIEYAFYVDINGERRKQYWYSQRDTIVHAVGEEVVNTYRITFFIRRSNGEIISKAVERRSRWSLCDGVLKAVTRLTDEQSTILEFGSGYGSKLISEKRRILSIEHDKDFINQFEGVKYLHAPLVEIKSVIGFKDTHWYNLESIRHLLPSEIDLIIIDGPPENIGRAGILHNLDKFSSTKFWVIDDVQRVDDQKLANYISFHFSMVQYRFWNFSVLSYHSIPSEIVEDLLRVSNSIASSEEKDYTTKFYPLPLQQ